MEKTTQRSRLRGYETERLLISHPRAMEALGIRGTKYRELRKSGVIEEVRLGRSKMATVRSVRRAAGAAD